MYYTEARDSQLPLYASAAAAQTQCAARHLSAMMVWEMVRRDQLELIAPACLHHVVSSIAPQISVKSAIMTYLATVASSDSQRWAGTDISSKILSLELVTATAKCHPSERSTAMSLRHKPSR